MKCCSWQSALGIQPCYSNNNNNQFTVNEVTRRRHPRDRIAMQVPQDHIPFKNFNEPILLTNTEVLLFLVVNGDR